MLRQFKLHATTCITLLCAFIGLPSYSAQTELSVGALPAGISSPVSRIGDIALTFEENKGQADPRTRYLTRGPGYQFLLREDSVLLHFDQPKRAAAADTLPLGNAGANLTMRFVGTKLHPELVTDEPSAERSNYLIGNDSTQYITNVPHAARLRYREVYPHVDVVYYGKGSRLEYDIVAKPGAKTDQIQIAWDGASASRVGTDGGLRLESPVGEVLFSKPIAYQMIDGVKHDVDASFVVASNGVIGFKVGAYDPRQSLVIDPLLTFSTPLWGSNSALALDSADNIYVTGTTSSADLPAGTGYQSTFVGTSDAFVIKLNPTATAVVYRTYLGVGRNTTTAGSSIAVDSAGSAYVIGTTNSTTYPITTGAYRTTGTNFLTKLNAAGTAIMYSTYLPDPVSSIAVDGSGNAYLGGSGSVLVATAGAYDTVCCGPYVAKLNATGTAMVFATYLPTNSFGGMALGSDGSTYVVGRMTLNSLPVLNAFQSTMNGSSDAYVIKLNPSGSSIGYATYLGGSQDEAGLGIAVDAAGEAFVTGWTISSDFPVTASAFQRSLGGNRAGQSGGSPPSNAFIAKLSSSGNSLLYASYLGGDWCFEPGVYSCFAIFSPGEQVDAGTSVAVDAAGFAYLGGYTTSSVFPEVDPIQVPMYREGRPSAFVAKVAPSGDRLVFSASFGTDITYSWSVGTPVKVDSNGNMIGLDFEESLAPITTGVLSGDSIRLLFKISPGLYPTTLTSNANPAGMTQALVLTAYAQAPTNGATMTFKDGATTLGTAAVSGGVATLSVTLAAGIHTITATNDADGKTSPSYFQIVRAQ